MNRLIIVPLIIISSAIYAQSPQVIAYYSAGLEKVDSIPAEKLNQIIFSFCHLKGNALTIDNANDSITIQKLVLLKKKNPRLKVLVSLGGWGGCASCSEVFATEKGRKEFATSVLQMRESFKVDGIDLDWEYPVVEGFPGHKYGPEDKQNFTQLMQALRDELGKNFVISFAAGGFENYLKEAIDWEAVVPLADYINLMSYDLINGYSTRTGHHTALYSRKEQKESTDFAVDFLLKTGVPANKIIIGAAFYGRMWEEVSSDKNGLYQTGKFKSSVDYRLLTRNYINKNGFRYYWDELAKAPYLYNSADKLFITYDDKRSVQEKMKYVREQNLGGIMFWELSLDLPQQGLLHEILRSKH
jgi:chitinase